jgi:predicted HicB family RNase H-like nuclease
MNNLLKYKNYMARVEFDAEDKIFFGRIANIDDIITFQGETVNELISGFEEAVDDYLQTCQKLGHEPKQPYSGNLRLKNIRRSPCDYDECRHSAWKNHSRMGK